MCINSYNFDRQTDRHFVRLKLIQIMKEAQMWFFRGHICVFLCE